MSSKPDRETIQTQLLKCIAEEVTIADKPLVLKGGTALRLVYGLDRFSEDLDFDVTGGLVGHVSLKKILDKACKQASADLSVPVRLSDYREPKKTRTTHRIIAGFDVGHEEHPLTIKHEISHRVQPDSEEITVQKGIRVYTIEALCALKLEAAQHRDAARDLHDLIFIACQWAPNLSNSMCQRLEAFLRPTVELAERYADAYRFDNLMPHGVFEDLEKAEQWLVERNELRLRKRLSNEGGPE